VNAPITKNFEYDEKHIYKGATPLMAAIGNKQPDIARLLVENGADIHAQAINGTTALLVAAASGESRIVQLLLSKNADHKVTVSQDFFVNGLTIFSGTNALLAAADAGDTDSIRILMNAGLTIPAANRVGVTALMAAAEKGHLESCKFLVSKGSNVNARTKHTFSSGKKEIPKGSSVLSGAVWEGYVDVVKYLLNQGADVNMKDNVWHMDPLFIAAMKGHKQVAKILIDHGADVFAECKLGTAHSTAHHNDYPEIVEEISNARKKVRQ